MDVPQVRGAGQVKRSVSPPRPPRFPPLPHSYKQPNRCLCLPPHFPSHLSASRLRSVIKLNGDNRNNSGLQTQYPYSRPPSSCRPAGPRNQGHRLGVGRSLSAPHTPPPSGVCTTGRAGCGPWCSIQGCLSPRGVTTGKMKTAKLGDLKGFKWGKNIKKCCIVL